jgi:hypothetical protein
MRTIKTTALLLLAGLTTACTSTLPSTSSQLNTDPDSLVVNTAQNIQRWPDGSIQVTTAAPESAQIASGNIDYQGTSLSALLAVGKDGINIRNPGNLTAEAVTIDFGDPLTGDDGSMVVPIQRIGLNGVSNEVTTVVDANTDQVALWVGVLGDLSENQALQVLQSLERDKVISSATLDAVSNALGLFLPVP